MTVEFKSNVGRIRNDTQDPTAESLLDLIKSPPPPLDHEIKTPHWTWVKVDLNQRLGDTRKKVEFVCESTVLYGRACDGVDYEAEGFVLNDGIWRDPTRPFPSKPSLSEKPKERIASINQPIAGSEKPKGVFSKIFSCWHK